MKSTRISYLLIALTVIVLGAIMSPACAEPFCFVASIGDDLVQRNDAGLPREWLGPAIGVINPWDVTYGPDGNLYISSHGSDNTLAGDKVIKYDFSNSVTPISDYAIVGEPMDIVFHNGVMYVQSNLGDDDKIYRRKADGTLELYVAKIGGRDFNFGPDHNGDGASDLYWAGWFSSGPGIYVFTGKDDPGTKFDSNVPEGSCTYAMAWGADVVGDDGVPDLLAADLMRDCVALHNGATGAYVSDLVASSSGELETPTDMTIVDGKIYIADQEGDPSWWGAIRVYDATTGEHIKSIEGLTAPSGIAFEPAEVVEPPAAPQFDPAGGTYATPVTVTISHPTTSATIRYTTDGSQPTDSSTIYTDPILVERTITIRARAWVDAEASPTTSATYIIAAYNNPQTIPYSDSIVIDGSLSDWAGSEWVALDQQYYVFGNWAECDMSNGKFALKWGANGTKLYIAIEVNDIDRVFSPDYGIWDSSDRVEMNIHTSATGSDDYITPGNVVAQQYTIGNNGTGGLWKGIAGDKPVPSSANFQCASSVVGDKIIYEAAMTAFESFGGLQTPVQANVADTLVARQVIGADASVCSRTTAGSYFQLSENTMSPKYLKTSAIGRHLLVANSTIDSVKNLADGDLLTSKGIVSAVFSDCFYIEATNRESGIRVGMPNHGRTVGQEVSVSGMLWTLASGERYIIANTVGSTGAGSVDPLAVNNKALGGGDSGILPKAQCGVEGGSGMNNIGLLVKTTGKVGTKGTGWFKIDDGSGVSVKVFGTAPTGTPYVTVTGISSCEKDAGLVQRAILATDILVNVP